MSAYVAKVNTYVGKTLHRTKPNVQWQLAYEQADNWRMKHYPNGSIALELIR